MYDECPKWPFSTSPRGYGQIVHNGKKRPVSNLVCELVHGPAPSPEHQAAHNCGKGHEGCFGARCVEWKTPVENRADAIRHGTHIHGEEHANAKLTEAQVNEIRRRALAGENQQRLAEEFGIVQSAVSNIKFGRRWARAA